MNKQKPHRKIYMITGTVAVIMFGFSFAIVPFYSVICRATGINTSVPTGELVTRSAAATKEAEDLNREVTIQFVAENNMGLPWDFYPKMKSVQVHPGQNTKVFFYAKNATPRNMTVQAIPSMTPTEAISHFHKIECFCLAIPDGGASKIYFNFQVDKDLLKNIRSICFVYLI